MALPSYPNICAFIEVIVGKTRDDQTRKTEAAGAVPILQAVANVLMRARHTEGGCCRPHGVTVCREFRCGINHACLLEP
jgi:hypothetical protein